MHLYVWKKLGKKRWLFTVIFHNNNNLVWVSLSYAHYTLHREFTFAHIHRRCLLFLSSGIYTYLIRCHYHEIWSYLWVGVRIKRILIKIVCSPIWCLLVPKNCCVFLFVNKRFVFVLEEQQRRVRDRNLSKRIKGKKRTKEKEQGTFFFIIFFKFTKKCVCLINNNDCLNLVSVWTISYKTYTRSVCRYSYSYMCLVYGYLFLIYLFIHSYAW